MYPRAAEYLTVLTEQFGKDLKIVGTEWNTEWNTMSYRVVAYIERIVVKELEKAKRVEDLKNYVEDGVAAIMDTEGIFDRDTFDEAIHDLFYYVHEKGLLE